MFVNNFISFIPITSYFIYIFLTLFFVLFISIRYFLGPTTLTSISFFIPAAIIFVEGNIADKIFTLIYCFVFFVFFKAGIKIRLGIVLIEKQYTYRKTKDLLYSYTILTLYFLLNIYLYFLISHDGIIDKLKWTVDSGGLHYLLSFLSCLSITVCINSWEKSKYYLLFISLALILFSSSLLGIKSAVINVAILILATIARQNLKTNTVLKILTIILIGLFLSLYFYFGGFSLPAFYNTLARFLATADGTYIILTSGMYEFYQLPENVFIYIFDVVISRFFGITESVGQQIASFSYDLKYPDFGGPNDSVFNYLLLSNTLGKFLLIIIVAAGAFASGYLEKVFKNKISTETDIMVKFIYYPLYIMMPMLFQGVGTFFIEIARIYLLYIPLIFSIYFVRRVHVKKTRRDNTFLC